MIMDVESRIAQFKNMAEADPDNDLGHFSLGKAYFEANRFEEAEPCLRRVLDLNPTQSKAYSLLGRTQMKLGRGPEAIATLKQGVEVASARGDRMPLDEMLAALAGLGVTVSREESAGKVADAAPADGSFRCKRCGRPSGALPDRPLRGSLGERIQATICADCWREWIGMGTKVINELGLQLSDPRAQAAYEEHMKEFLQIEDA
jgi:Fe-S cluster biosynthesis and repair protein YggX